MTPGRVEGQLTKPGRRRLEAVEEHDEERDNVERHGAVDMTGEDWDRKNKNDEDEEEHDVIIKCLVFLSGVDLESPRLDRQV